MRAYRLSSLLGRQAVHRLHQSRVDRIGCFKIVLRLNSEPPSNRLGAAPQPADRNICPFLQACRGLNPILLLEIYSRQIGESHKPIIVIGAKGSIAR